MTMFQKMRRSNQQLSKEESVLLLQQCQSGILGVIGDDGYPYTVPINYVYHDGHIYFHCAKEGHKLEAIQKHEKVSFTVVEKEKIVPSQLTTFFQSVILFGKAHIIEDTQLRLQTIRLLASKYSQDKENIEKEIKTEWNRLCCVDIEIEHISGKEAIEYTKIRKNS